MTRLYFAGLELGHEAGFRLAVNGVDMRDVLISFEHSGKFSPRRQADFYNWVASNGLKVMVDSGIFSLYKRPPLTTTELMAYYESYARYLHKYKGCYEIAVNLDVDKLVGFGEQWSDDFYNRLTRQGLCILPVWHFRKDSDFDRLARMAANHERVAIGVNALRTKRSTKNDELFKARLDRIYSKYPDNKFHLLGLTDPSVLMTHRVYSCDSSTWVQKAKYGDIVYWNPQKLKICYTHQRNTKKLRDIVPRFGGLDFSLDRALNLSGSSSTESMWERGRLAMLAFIRLREFIKTLWEKKYDGIENKKRKDKNQN